MSEDDVAPRGEKPPVDSMLNAIQREMFPEGALPTGWVLTSEWMSLDGQFYVVTLTDQDNPVWRHIGMLTKAQTDLDEDLATIDEDEDEELE